MLKDACTKSKSHGFESRNSFLFRNIDSKIMCLYLLKWASVLIKYDHISVKSRIIFNKQNKVVIFEIQFLTIVNS